MKGKIAVTPRSLSRSGHPALAGLRAAGYEVIFPTPGRQPTLDELRQFLPGCTGYLAGVEPIPADVLALCPELRVISRNGVGVDNIDLAAAHAQGITITKAVGANARGVAELAITLMLAGLRYVPWSVSRLKAGTWARQEGIEVRSRMLGVVGCGQIGKHVAEMAVGLGMRVRAFDLYPDWSFCPAGDFAFCSLEEIWRSADVISLHCPPAGRPVVDAAALACMQPGTYLVNTARATLIDEDAVLQAIERGILRGYATDVYAQEPPVMTPLLQHERVICTPHAGGFTVESVERATEAAVANLLQVLEGTSVPAADPAGAPASIAVHG
jgi:D-3-phosphoglycerate dehydrogenase